MTPEEIKKEISQLNRMLKRLCDESNIIWAEKDKLRSSYKKLTGEEI